jgi:hypothetical protein
MLRVMGWAPLVMLWVMGWGWAPLVMLRAMGWGCPPHWVTEMG